MTFCSSVAHRILYLGGLACLCICLGLTGCESEPDPGQTSGPIIHGKGVYHNVHLSVTRDSSDQPNIFYDYQYNSLDTVTVLDLLVKASEEKGFDIDYSGSGETAFVKSIDGLVGGQDGRGWWIYFVNNKLAQEGAGVVKLKNGDQVEWRLGQYRPNADDSSEQKED